MKIANKKQNYWRRGAESNRRIKVLQTSALPLGYRAARLPTSAPYHSNGVANAAPPRMNVMSVSSVFKPLWRKIQQPPPHPLTESLFLRLLGLV
jgi:hypothetical protein